MERIPDVSARHAHRATDVAWEEKDGRVTLRRAKFGPGRAAVLRLLRQPTDLTVHLDPLGAAVWQLCDGRTVADILQEVQRRFPDEADLRQRMGRFLSTMVSRELVRLD